MFDFVKTKIAGRRLFQVPFSYRGEDRTRIYRRMNVSVPDSDKAEQKAGRVAWKLSQRRSFLKEYPEAAVCFLHIYDLGTLDA